MRETGRQKKRGERETDRENEYENEPEKSTGKNGRIYASSKRSTDLSLSPGKSSST